MTPTDCVTIRDLQPSDQLTVISLVDFHSLWKWQHQQKACSQVHLHGQQPSQHFSYQVPLYGTFPPPSSSDSLRVILILSADTSFCGLRNAVGWNLWQLCIFSSFYELKWFGCSWFVFSKRFLEKKLMSSPGFEPLTSYSKLKIFYWGKISSRTYKAREELLRP